MHYEQFLFPKAAILILLKIIKFSSFPPNFLQYLMIFLSSSAHLTRSSILKNHQILQKSLEKIKNNLSILSHYLNGHFWNQKCLQCNTYTTCNQSRFMICVTKSSFCNEQWQRLFRTNFDTWRKRKLAKIVFAAKFSATTTPTWLKMHLLRFSELFNCQK